MDKTTIKETYDILAQASGPERARELLTALLPDADLDAALVEPTTAALLDELCELAEQSNTGSGDKRRKSLRIALEAGANRKTLEKIAVATRVFRGDTVVLPAGRFEGLSRGKGWARKGKGDNATWGERDDAGGYRVGPGSWTVGSTDGFRRKSQEKWKVVHITVGAQTWTLAT